MMTERELAKRIRDRIGAIPVNQRGYISPAMERISAVLSPELLNKIAEVAAHEAVAQLGATTQ